MVVRETWKEEAQKPQPFQGKTEPFASYECTEYWSRLQAWRAREETKRNVTVDDEALDIETIHTMRKKLSRAVHRNVPPKQRGTHDRRELKEL